MKKENIEIMILGLVSAAFVWFITDGCQGQVKRRHLIEECYHDFPGDKQCENFPEEVEE